MRNDVENQDAGRHILDVVKLRRMVEEDLSSTLAWRNDERSRWCFKRTELLQPEEHLAWFRRREADFTDRMFIGERVADGRAVAQAAIYGIDWNRKGAEVGRFLSDPDLRGRGYFAQVMQQVLDVARDELALTSVHLEALADNARALAIYTRAGFATTGRANGLVQMECRLA